MSAHLSPAARNLLMSDIPATVITIDQDGTPHPSVAWVELDGDEILVGTLVDQPKLRNLRRDPRAVVTLIPGTYDRLGIHEYLVIHGTARVTEGGAAELLQHLAHRYMGPDVVFPTMPDPPPGFITRIRIERVSGRGDWTV